LCPCCILEYEWSPALTISKKLLHIQEMLTYPGNENCNLNGDVAII
jgi:ubiquitin-protein ligase